MNYNSILMQTLELPEEERTKLAIAILKSVPGKSVKKILKSMDLVVKGKAPELKIKKVPSVDTIIRSKSLWNEEELLNWEDTGREQAVKPLKINTGITKKKDPKVKIKKVPSLDKVMKNKLMWVDEEFQNWKNVEKHMEMPGKTNAGATKKKDPKMKIKKIPSIEEIIKNKSMWIDEEFQNWENSGKNSHKSMR